MATMKVTMEKAKETKGTWQFKEKGGGTKIGTLYIPKTTLAEIGDPQTVTVSLEGAK